MGIDYHLGKAITTKILTTGCSMDSGTTHFEGCACHELARNNRMAELERENEALRRRLTEIEGQGNGRS